MRWGMRRPRPALPRPPLAAVATLLAIFALGPLAGGANGTGGAGVEVVEGTVVADHADDLAGAERAPVPLHVLRSGGRDRVLEAPQRTLAGLDAGERGQVRGQVDGDEIEVRSAESSQGTAAQAAVGGDRDVAVILADFAMSPNRHSTDAARRAIFTDPGSTAAYYAETSNGAISLSGRDRTDGDVYGPVQVDQSGGGCAWQDWRAAALNGLSAQTSLSGYEHFVIVLPPGHGCSWSGLASVGGNWSMLADTVSTQVAAHEIGHNLRLDHAASQTCTAGGARVAISDSCTVSEYGDPFDVLGNRGSRLLNATHRLSTGWIAAGAAPVAGGPGSYRLDRLASAGGATRALRVARGDGTSLYLETRRTYGVFDAFASGDAAVNGLLIRIGSDDPGAVELTRLLDMHPATTSFADAPLRSGESFTDPVSGATVSLEGIDATGAGLRLSYGGPVPPSPVAPGAAGAPANAPDAPDAPDAGDVPAPPPTTPAFETNRATALRAISVRGRVSGGAGALASGGGHVSIRARQGRARAIVALQGSPRSGRLALRLTARASRPCVATVRMRRGGRQARIGQPTRIATRLRSFTVTAPGDARSWLSPSGRASVDVGCAGRGLRSLQLDRLTGTIR